MTKHFIAFPFKKDYLCGPTITLLPKVIFNNKNAVFFQSLKEAADEYFTRKGIQRTGDSRLYLKTAVLFLVALAFYFFILFFSLPVWAIIALSCVFGFILVDQAHDPELDVGLGRAVQSGADVLPRLALELQVGQVDHRVLGHLDVAVAEALGLRQHHAGRGEEGRHPAVGLAVADELEDRVGHRRRVADGVAERDRGAALDLVGDGRLAVGRDEVRVVRPGGHPGEVAAAVGVQQLEGPLAVDGGHRLAGPDQQDEQHAEEDDDRDQRQRHEEDRPRAPGRPERPAAGEEQPGDELAGLHDEVRWRVEVLDDEEPEDDVEDEPDAEQGQVPRHPGRRRRDDLGRVGLARPYQDRSAAGEKRRRRRRRGQRPQRRRREHTR